MSMCMILWQPKASGLPSPSPHQSICATPRAGWLPGLFWRKYQMTWLPAANPGHQGGLLSQYPFFGLFSSTSCFQVRGKVKALRMRSRDVTTRHAGGAALFSPTRRCSIYFFFTSSCSIIFISLAQAFTAINTVSKVRFLFFSHAAIH